MPTTPQPFATTSGGPVAPVSARLRDYALLSGACGGAVFPTDKGLAAVTGDLPWRVQSGIVGSIWLQLLLADPNVKPLFAGTALADPDWVKIAAIAFFQLVPLLSSQGIFELGANPLAPPPAKGKAKKA